jgi:hypothetical protein
MASAAPHHHNHHHHQESMITIKVNYQGFTRKCKLPLRDMVPGVLEEKVSFSSSLRQQLVAFAVVIPQPISSHFANSVVALIAAYRARAARALELAQMTSRYLPRLDSS